MTSEHQQRIRELLAQMNELSSAARTRMLDAADAQDPALRRQVEDLLATDGVSRPLEHSSLLDLDTVGTEVLAQILDDMAPHEQCGEDTVTVPPPTLAQPTRIGPYRIREQIGEGGMGVVYLAEQTAPIARKVALKIIKLGMDTRAVIARFEAERQALALMDHPNVAKVYDAGTTEQSRPYFVMELVRGIPITDYCDRHTLTTAQRLRLLIPVCHAVQHAHQKAIIHRDIKPSNILVTLQNGKPTPKVIDFGVAKATEQKLTEKTLFTEQGQLIGTPEYMSPEQAEMTALNVDTRTDVYSLGVVMYELLVGTLPFEPGALRRAAFSEIQRMIREQEPPKPSTRLSGLGPHSNITAHRHGTDRASLERELRGDLDWIVMKAIHKDRTMRYATASELAADIERHLSHEPVHAGPPSAAYRLRKFVKRNKTGVVAVVVVLLTLTAGLVTTTAQWLRAEANEQLATTRAQEAAVAAENEGLARVEAEKRRAELQTVTTFQQRMLGDVDAFMMGQAIIGDLRSFVQEHTRKTADPQATYTLADFDAALSGVNRTDLALSIIDQEILGKAVEAIDREFDEQSLTGAALRQTVASVYHSTGLYAKAHQAQQSALATRRRELGDDHLSTLESINSMGFLLKDMGQHEEAERYCRDALAGYRQALGDDDPLTLSAANNLGLVLWEVWRFDEAEPYLREAVEGDCRVLGDDHPSTLVSLNNLGLLLMNTGQLEEAEQLFTRALEGARRHFGNDNLHTVAYLSNMGALLTAVQRFDEATRFVDEAHASCRRVHGENHPATFKTLFGKGWLLQMMGRLDEAQQVYRQVILGQRQSLGVDHTDTRLSMAALGYVLLHSQDYDEAERILRECVAARERLSEAAYKTWWNAETLLGGVLLGQANQLVPDDPAAAKAKLAEAEPLLLEGYERLQPPPYLAVLKLESLLRIVSLYELWEVLDPGTGHATQAAEWQAKQLALMAQWQTT